MYYPGSVIKSLIIDALAVESQLNAKELHWVVVQNLENSVSIQALYKALKSLVHEGVILKNRDSNFYLSPIYIEKVKNLSSKFHEEFEELHHMRSVMSELDDKGEVSHSFKSRTFALNYLRDVALGMMLQKDPEEVRIYKYLFHFGSLQMVHTSDAIEHCVQKNYQVELYLHGKTPVDLRAKELLEAKGEKVYLVDADEFEKPFTEWIIVNEYVGEISMSEEYLALYNRVMEESNLEAHPSSDYVRFMKGELDDSKIEIVIEKNEKKAKELIQLLKGLQ
jgi:Fe2+ or Zn2+ uptake regulation protein